MSLAEHKQRTVRGVVALLAAVSLTTAACGNRTERPADNAAAPAANTPAAGDAAASTPAPDAAVGADPGTATDPGAAAGATGSAAAPSGTQPAAAAPGATNRPGPAAKSAPGAKSAAGSASPGGAAAGGGAASGNAGSGSNAATPKPTAPKPAPGQPATPAVPPPGSSPVILASIGTQSGPAASTLKPVTDGAQLWVKHINAKGGLNGHPVKLFVYDDNGDPARHRAQAQEAIERQKAIAFLANAEPLTGQGSVDYINSKGVPVIGTSGGTVWSYSSPMYFPQASDGDPFLLMGLAALADQVKDKKKLATVTCAEATACGDADRLFAENAKKFGYNHVYRARASIAQPDYTAECLAARNAGADVYMVVLDGNSVSRFAAACARQAYKPQFSTIVTIVLDRFKDDPNLGSIAASSHVFPYFQTGTPATDEFQAAFKAYGGGLSNGVGVAAGWTAGKLLEKAAARLPEPPTTQAILAGLWSIKNDNLGGLTYPLTFTEGKPATPRGCWFNTAVKDGKWISPDGYRLRCLDG
jgi:branched-chain amino acid transport system substrate-binding protein